VCCICRHGRHSGKHSFLAASAASAAVVAVADKTAENIAETSVEHAERSTCDAETETGTRYTLTCKFCHKKSSCDL
jgi:cytochrome c5